MISSLLFSLFIELEDVLERLKKLEQKIQDEEAKKTVGK
jgi:hypothetical protein